MDGKGRALPAAGLARAEALRSMRTAVSNAVNQQVRQGIMHDASDDKPLLRFLILHRWDPEAASTAFLSWWSQRRSRGEGEGKPSSQASTTSVSPVLKGTKPISQLRRVLCAPLCLRSCVALVSHSNIYRTRTRT